MTSVWSLIIAAGVLLGGIVIWQTASLAATGWMRRTRWIIAGLTLYSLVEFVHAILTGTAVSIAFKQPGLIHGVPILLHGISIGCFMILPLAWMVSIIRAGIPRFRLGSAWPWASQAVALTTCIALLTASLFDIGPASDRARPLSPEQRSAMLDSSVRAIADGNRETPRDRWDPDYVVLMVGRDPQRLFRWVQQNTYWIPYRGVLRGPVGVLMDRQGNSLDRALLLATLLDRMGRNARLAHGELTRAESADMLPQMVAEREIYFIAPENESARQVDLRPAALQYGLPYAGIEQTVNRQEQAATRVAMQLDERVVDQARRLLRVTAPKDPDAEWANRFQTNIAALRDHWWVQVEEDNRWLDLDLLVGDGSRSVALASAKETIALKDLAGELYHQIAIRVIAEQWSAGGVKERKALEHILRPADVIGQPIVLQFMPTEWLAQQAPVVQPVADIRPEALRQSEWAAGLVVAGKDVASAVLHDSGVDSTAQKGGVFGFGAALDETMKQGRSASAPSRILSAVWLEYEIRVPGEKPRTIRRTVFDLLGPAARASGAQGFRLDDTKKLTRALALEMKTEILPMVCQFAPEFVAHLTAEPIAADQELLDSILKPDFSPDSEKTKQQLTKATPPVSPLIGLAFMRLEWNHASQHFFLDRPNILTRHQSLTSTPKGIALQSAIDVVANDVGVNLTASDAFAVRLQQGVRDTNSEALLFGGGGTGNTGNAFADSSDWLTITPSERSVLDRVSVSDDTRRRIAQDLDAGFIVVTPKSAVHRGNEDFAGWWRINPETGYTLGVAENGWGQDLTEEEVHINGVLSFAEAFFKENVFCHLFSQGTNLFLWEKELLLGAVAPEYSDWHPDFASGARKSKDPREVYQESKNLCLISAIVLGFVATLPLLLLTLRNSRSIRALRAAEEAAEGLPPRRNPPRNPCPELAWEPFTRLPFASLFITPMAAMLLSGTLPCVPGHGPGPGGSGRGSGSSGRGGGNRSGDGSGGNNGSKSPPSEPPPKPPDPCDEPRGSGGRSGESSEPNGPPTQPYPDAVKQLEANLETAKAAEEQASNEYMKAVQDFLAQKVNKPNLVFKTGGDPSKFDQAAFDQAQKALDQAWKNYIGKESARIAAQEALDQSLAELRRQQGGTGGQGGGAAGQCGGAGGGQSGTGEAQQVAGGGQTPPKPGTSLDPALGDPITDPNGPPTVRDPGAHDNGPPTVNDPYNDPAHAPTEAVRPPGQYQVNVNNGGPRNPTVSAQKTAAGAGGAFNALGGSK